MLFRVDRRHPPPSESALIELSNVTRVYELGEVTVHALAPTTLTIERGEYVALVGPSGSGKSTLMNTLGCLDRPSSGSYRLDGVEIADMARDQRAQIRNQQIGFVFQNFNLLNRTSALENVELPLLYARHLSARDRRRRATEELQRVGLGDRLDHHPSQLSGGQQQRVAIARALVNRPQILIELFQRLNVDEGITVILVTHDQDVARNARRTIVLRDGRVIADTTDFSQALKSLRSGQAIPSAR
jgi:ABC-type lipoprotein export system ATPase subunit